jgi:hypothetical protein
MSDVTQILSQIESGDPAAAEQLPPLVYEELRKLVAAKLAQEKPGQTLQATALVHEAYARLVGSETHRTYRERSHFFASAATAMRRILVDSARANWSDKRGGVRERKPLEDVAAPLPDDGVHLSLAPHRRRRPMPNAANPDEGHVFGILGILAGIVIRLASESRLVGRVMRARARLLTAERCHWTPRFYLFCYSRQETIVSGLYADKGSNGAVHEIGSARRTIFRNLPKP